MPDVSDRQVVGDFQADSMEPIIHLTRLKPDRSSDFVHPASLGLLGRPEGVITHSVHPAEDQAFLPMRASVQVDLSKPHGPLERQLIKYIQRILKQLGQPVRKDEIVVVRSGA